MSGSSPLTRGKPGAVNRRYRSRRLIPAHAGKTTRGRAVPTIRPAHPRSRGENFTSGSLTERPTGSSPLTRGKPVMHVVQGLAGRLIPAHAGKTQNDRGVPTDETAHPRSRGENSLTPDRPSLSAGSSPLTRGKPWTQLWVRRGRRLIPAHAGKTARSRPWAGGRPAHPRSRGENHLRGPLSEQRNGSSPLTRGKLDRDVCEGVG